jgi:hypothetical protein
MHKPGCNGILLGKYCYFFIYRLRYSLYVQQFSRARLANKLDRAAEEEFQQNRACPMWFHPGPRVIYRHCGIPVPFIKGKENIPVGRQLPELLPDIGQRLR